MLIDSMNIFDDKFDGSIKKNIEFLEKCSRERFNMNLD